MADLRNVTNTTVFKPGICKAQKKLPFNHPLQDRGVSNENSSMFSKEFFKKLNEYIKRIQIVCLVYLGTFWSCIS